MFAHAEATKSMAAAHMRKAALLEDQNLLMLMSMPDADSDAKEYLHLRRQMELRKLRKLLAEEEDRDHKFTAVNAGECSHGAKGEGLHSQHDTDAEN
jgi:hypothetical protein